LLHLCRDNVVDRALLGSLAGSLVLAAAVEIVVQLRLLTRFLDALPPAARAALPRHPRRPGLAFLGSTRFFLAIWRSFRHDLPEDSPAVLALKHRMRASLRREMFWAAGTVAATVALVAAGWRPIWP
jgi:hypothetical protein